MEIEIKSTLTSSTFLYYEILEGKSIWDSKLNITVHKIPFIYFPDVKELKYLHFDTVLRQTTFSHFKAETYFVLSYHN